MKSYEEYYMEIIQSIFKRKKPIVISIWAIVFTIILLPNLYFFYLLGTTRGLATLGFEGLGVAILGLLLLVIDFIVVLFYVIKQKPHGTAKLISYIILTLVGLILVYFGLLWNL